MTAAVLTRNRSTKDSTLRSAETLAVLLSMVSPSVLGCGDSLQPQIIDLADVIAVRRCVQLGHRR